MHVIFISLSKQTMLSRNSRKFGDLLCGRIYSKGAIKCLSSQATATDTNQKQQEDALLRGAKPFLEMPAPPMWPIIGNAWQFFPVVGCYDIHKVHEVIRHKRQLYGNVWREKFGFVNMVISFSADDMETIFRNEGPYPSRMEFLGIKVYRESRKEWYKSTGLLILQGKEWQDLRSKTQKYLMKPRAIQAYTGSMQDVAIDFVQRMETVKDSNNEIPNFLEELYKWSLESVAYVGLDTRLGCFDSDKETDGLKMIRSVQTQFELMNKLGTFYAGVYFQKVFRTPMWRKFEKASDVFSEIAFKYINRACEELKKVDKENDKELTLLQSMLATKDLALEGAMVTVADMLFAGIDTTAHTVGFLLYELAKNQSKQELLHQEIIKLLPSSDSRLTPAVVLEFRYLKSCLKESFRLHPIVSAGGRAAVRDVVISGYRVPAKTFIGVYLRDVCLDEKQFKNPSQFLPERWQNKDERTHPFACLPFGVGARSCIGRRLAELEIMCLIAEVIRKYKVEYHYEDIDILTKFINAPDKPLRFTFIERK